MSTTLKTVNSQQREFTLTNPQKYLKKNSIIKSKKENQFSWYYIHFLTEYITKISEDIKIERENKILQNTYVLYLSNSQLNKISNISLVIKIESDDKYYENDVSYAKTNYLIVTTFSGYHLQSNEELYSIQMQFAENSYIVRIDRNGLTEGDFLQKKKRTIKFLTKISEVKTPFMKPVLHNVISSGYTQKNSFEFKQLPGRGYFYLDRYLNANGINGEGEVITILDTIIDYTHSMFRDDNVSVQLNTKLDNHRKFVY